MRVYQFNMWPPTYSIKRSVRARRVNLKISAHAGLELILPMCFKLQEIPNILQEKREWIEKHLANIQQVDKNKELLPQQFHLLSCAEEWKIYYVSSSNPPQIIVRPNNELTLLGDLENISACRRVLTGWLREKAQHVLPPILQALSLELNLPFKSLTIRSQKTRWGSCSSRGAISLNYKLIFLKPELVRHVLIHELCHTVHLDHSSKFWKQVTRFDENWRCHHALIQRSENLIPLWL